MKRISFLLSLALMTGLMVPSAYAAPDVYQETNVIQAEFGNFEIESTIRIYDSIFRSSGRRADKSISVKSNGEVIADITLSVTFGYDGKTVWISNSSSSHTTYNGWSYNNEDILESGGTATLTATLTHNVYRSIPISTSLTCSPTGQIS